MAAILGVSCSRESATPTATFKPVVTIVTPAAPAPAGQAAASQATNTPLVLPTATSATGAAAPAPTTASANTQATTAPTAASSQATAAATTDSNAAKPTAAPAAASTSAPASGAAPTITANTAKIPNAAPVAALPGGTNPFTGLPLDAARLNRRPVFIKVANTAEVRPQSGLSSADVVFEHLTEGDITRYAALYLGNDSSKVGSVRSCRLIDVELPAIFDAGLVCSGTSPGVKPVIRDSIAHKDNRTMISDFGPYECLSPCSTLPMFRSSETVAPHNLFGTTIGARKELDSRGKNTPSGFRSWSFDAAAPANGVAANQVSIPYRSGTVGWTYGNGAYTRNLFGAVQTDRANGKAIAVSNVIIMYVNHVFTDIVEDTTGAKSIQIQLWNQGPVTIVRDGVAIDGQWQRHAAQNSLVFVDPSGNHIPLKPGNSWVQFVPLNYGVTVK
ncbi:MAG: DUF3048 domain-containing protein [Anaerolineae bacterium]|nr:DUF3048 domain-containing protein [Anaerolineae bacterium]